MKNLIKNLFKTVREAVTLPAVVAVSAILAVGGLLVHSAFAGSSPTALSPSLGGGNDNVGIVSLLTTNVISSLSTNTTAGANGCGNAVDISGFDNIGIIVSGTNATSTNVPVVIQLARSQDNVWFENAATPPMTFTVTFPANSQYVFYTNFNYDTVGSVAWLKCVSLVNTSNAVVGVATNDYRQFQISVSTKRKAAPR